MSSSKTLLFLATQVSSGIAAKCKYCYIKLFSDNSGQSKDNTLSGDIRQTSLGAQTNATGPERECKVNSQHCMCRFNLDHTHISCGMAHSGVRQYWSMTTGVQQILSTQYAHELRHGHTERLSLTARKVFSRLLPDTRFLTFVRTNADPFPGFTCKNSRILQGEPTRASVSGSVARTN